MYPVNSNEETLSNGWITLRLSELFFYPTNDVVDGPFGSNLKTSDYTNLGVPILRVQNIERNQFINKNIQFISNEKADELSRHSYQIGDIVLTKLGNPLGKACIVPDSFENGIIVADLVRLRLEHDLINKKFLVYAINGPLISNQLKEHTKGTTRPRVTLGHIRNLQVELPPRAEQNRIVAKIEELFSELDKGIEHLITAQEQLKIYRQSVLKYAFEGKLTEQWRETHADQLETAEQLLERIQQERENLYQQQVNEWEEEIQAWEENGKETNKPSKPQMPLVLSPLTEEEVAELPNLPAEWCWVKLSSLSEKIQIGPFGSLLHRLDYVEDGVPFVNPVHISNQTINPDRIFTVTQRKLDELSNYIMYIDDIVMARRGEMGRCAVVTDKEDGFLCGSGSLFIRPLPEINPYYCCQFLSSHKVKSYLSERSIGTTMKNLNQSILKNVPIPLCSVTEQEKVIEELDGRMILLREIEIEIEKNLQKATVLRHSILKKAFSGRLVLQDPNDEPASILLERIRAERQAAPKPTRTPGTSRKKTRKKEVVDLISVLQSAGTWLSTQDAFRECGVSDGAETEMIEKLYLELRDLEKGDRIEVERRGNEDWLRIRPVDRS